MRGALPKICTAADALCDHVNRAEQWAGKERRPGTLECTAEVPFCKMHLLLPRDGPQALQAKGLWRRRQQLVSPRVHELHQCQVRHLRECAGPRPASSREPRARARAVEDIEQETFQNTWLEPTAARRLAPVKATDPCVDVHSARAATAGAPQTLWIRCLSRSRWFGPFAARLGCLTAQQAV